MYKIIIFDLDDTLILEMDYILSGFDHISREISFDYDIKQDVIYYELLNSFEESYDLVINRTLDKLKLQFNKVSIEKYVNSYRHHMPILFFSNDVLAEITKLHQKYILAIITDGDQNSQAKKLQALNASKYFDKIIITDRLGKEFWKPNPKSFELLKEEYAVDFEQMIYVGDNECKDFHIKNIYPITTIRLIRDGAIIKDCENKVAADYEIDKICDIELIIARKEG